MHLEPRRCRERTRNDSDKKALCEHWQYDEAVSYTKKDNDALNEYHHHKLPAFYAEYGHPLEDEELDEFVYGYPISQTA